VAAGSIVQALPGAGLDREPSIRAVRAKADAFVSDATPRRNFGQARLLAVDGAPTIRTYLRFDVDLRSDDVRHASLLLYSLRRRLRTGYKVRLVSGRWNEREITYANAPEGSPPSVSSGALGAGSWKAIDLTSLVAGKKAVNLVLSTESTNGALFASRETGRHGPRLVIERQPGETTGSTTTSTGASPQPPPPPPS
jgi:hypothetical protein